jgi:hypothetical protein
MNIKETKDQARALVASLHNLGIRLKHHQALEVMAKIKGAKGWNQLAAGETVSKSTQLSPEQQIILEEALRMHVSAQGIPDEEPVKIVMAGDVFGNVGYLDGFYLDRCGLLEVIMTITHSARNTASNPLVHFMSAVLTNEGGQCKATQVQVLEYEELLNATLDLELKYNNAAVRSTCPLTYEQHKPYIGVYPFLAGTWSPLWRDIVPARVWEAVAEIEPRTGLEPLDSGSFAKEHAPYQFKEGMKLRLTVGELKAFLKSERAGLDALEAQGIPVLQGSASGEKTPLSNSLFNDDGSPF